MSMEGKVCIVTGANSGVGKATTEGLAAQGSHVVMVCRDQEKAARARDEILKAIGSDPTDPDPIEIMICDLSSQASIRELALDILDSYDRIDVLVNNAGGINGKRTLTVDGIETTFAVNHLAPFLLTNLLLERLQNSAPSRVVTVSSEAHRYGFMDLDNLQGEKRYNSWTSYSISKLCNILFTIELDRRLRTKGNNQLTVNCLHPGVVRTNFAHNSSAVFKVGWAIAYPFMISAERGARTSIYLASSPEVEEVSGKYFKRGKVVTSTKVSRDREMARKVWEISERLTGLR